ncbi:wax ester/triacylglycerol synthase family O-acyltransferase [Ideonella sp. DXS29W]|uniref:diacylglycerol O-acyltransferase n=1 Tax=Ideonella lacteola TaxID=2984193 RepID=A0ABU9BYQ6_9BURK
MLQLSGLDATFLYIESPEMPMHVGALHMLELPAGYRGRFVKDLRALMAARLPLMPALRRRLWWMPLNMANPVWVDAVPDLAKHIVEFKLPVSAKKGDGLAELHAAVGQLHPQLLDRSRPLWMFHVLEGLGPSTDGRKRVGLYSQVHHAAVDGQAAVALANILFDLTPEPRAIEVRPSKRAKTFRHDMAEMLRGAIAGQAMQVAKLIRELPAAASGVTGAALSAARNTSWLGKSHGKVSNLALAPRTALNASVTPSRAFASLSLPLGEMKSLAKLHGCSLNDVVLFVCASGLRKYFAQRGWPIPRKPMVAAVPISLRQPGDTSSDNQASLSFISLGTHLADPQKRLAHIKAASASMKATMGSLKSVLPTDFPSLGIPWLIEAARSMYGKARVAEKIPPVATLTISNVPGPQVPLYLAGARMLTNYPTSIVVHGLALNVTVQSFDTHMDFGMMADAEAMPDVSRLADAVQAAYGELQWLPAPDAGASATSGRAGRQANARSRASKASAPKAPEAKPSARPTPDEKPKGRSAATPRPAPGRRSATSARRQPVTKATGA